MLQLLLLQGTKKIRLLSILLGLFVMMGLVGINGTPAKANGQDGSIDPNFATGITGSGSEESIYTTATQSDGKIIVVGSFTSYNGIPSSYIARLNLDGSVDTSFNPGTGANNRIVTIVVQVNGKIIIGGSFTSYNGISRSYIARLNSDGSLDTSFDAHLQYDDVVRLILIQSDSKIVIGGLFDSNSSSRPKKIIRTNSNGSRDNSFNFNSDANEQNIWSLALQNDGKILVSSIFNKPNGGYYFLMRINPDGSPDLSFDTGAGDTDYVYQVVIQNDGKILVVTSLGSFNGTYRRGILRLNSDGSFDPTFDTGIGVGQNGFVQGAVIQPDNKIIIFGRFLTYQNVERNGMARINPDGSLDPTFDPGIRIRQDSLSIGSVVLQSDTKILLTWRLDPVDVYPRNRLNRLQNTATPVSTIAVGSSINPSELNETVTFMANLSPITATGVVSFTFGGSTTVTSILVNGVASYVTNTLPIGQTGVKATYSGDAYLLPSTSQIYTQTVTKAATSITVTSTPNPSIVGQSAMFTATVNPAVATGTVTFTIGITNITASFSNGIATYVTNTLPIGSYPVTATYGGSAVYNTSVSTGQYIHTVVTPCDPMVVTSNTDDGTASSCGTFSYAVLNTTSGMTVTFSVTNVNFSGVLTPSLRPGVVIDGGANGVILDGSSLAGDGLMLGGNNTLINLIIKGFNGRGLVVTTDKTGNKLDHVKITKT